MSLNVQACAKQILGKEPVQFPIRLRKICNGKFSYLFPTEAKPGTPEADQPKREPRPHTWNHALGYKQWWIDALTCDPSHMMEGTGLWEHGRPQPVSCSKLVNAKPGSLPCVMAYLAAHAKHGTRVFYPYHGARHGSVDKKTGEFLDLSVSLMTPWYNQSNIHAHIQARSLCLWTSSTGSPA